MLKNLLKIGAQIASKNDLIAVLVDEDGQVLDAVWDGVDDGIIIITDSLKKYLMILAEILKDTQSIK
jgi:hypothetical protein